MTAPASSAKPKVSTSDMNLPIWRGGKFAAAAAAGLEVALVAVADVAERLVRVELDGGEAEIDVGADRALRRVVHHAIRRVAEHLFVQGSIDKLLKRI